MEPEMTLVCAYESKIIPINRVALVALPPS